MFAFRMILTLIATSPATASGSLLGGDPIVSPFDPPSPSRQCEYKMDPHGSIEQTIDDLRQILLWVTSVHPLMMKTVAQLHGSDGKTRALLCATGYTVPPVLSESVWRRNEPLRLFNTTIGQSSSERRALAHEGSKAANHNLDAREARVDRMLKNLGELKEYLARDRDLIYFEVTLIGGREHLVILDLPVIVQAEFRGHLDFLNALARADVLRTVRAFIGAHYATVTRMTQLSVLRTTVAATHRRAKTIDAELEATRKLVVARIDEVIDVVRRESSAKTPTALPTPTAESTLFDAARWVAAAERFTHAKSATFTAHEVDRAVHELAAGLNELQLRSAALTTREIDWARWHRTRDEGGDWTNHLIDELGRRRREAFRVLDELRALHDDVTGLRGWLERTSAALPAGETFATPRAAAQRVTALIEQILYAIQVRACGEGRALGDVRGIDLLVGQFLRARLAGEGDAVPPALADGLAALATGGAP